MGKMKQAAMTTTAIAKTETVNTPAIQYDNPWLEAAAEAGSEFGPLLKFNKGDWLIGTDEIPQGTEFVAHIDELRRGWAKFGNDELTDLRMVKIADGGKLSEREELGDLDPKKWEKDDDGKPRDPWVKQWYLPLVSIEVGDLCTFVTSSAGGNSAIANLCRVFGNRQHNGLPIIALKTRTYKHKKWGEIKTPDFAIVGWNADGPSMTAAQPVNQIAPKTGNAAANADMNHEIPF